MPRGKRPEEEKATKMSISFYPQDLERIIKYCQAEERPISWVIRKACNEWLEKKGY